MELNDKTVKIKVEKLRKCFGDLEVLRDISTEIHEGEVGNFFLTKLIYPKDYVRFR